LSKYQECFSKFFALFFELFYIQERKGVRMDLASRVRAERERVKLSQEKLAQHMGMDRNTLWHIEAGRTKNPRADQIIALAQALEVSADYLLGLTDDPTPATQRSTAAPSPRPRAPRAQRQDATAPQPKRQRPHKAALVA
jgi:transcriptional regulator with XRE-family HTH domain